MKRYVSGASVALLAAAMAAGPNDRVHAQAAASATVPAIGSLPDGHGRELTARVCSGCHGLEVIAQKRLTAASWHNLIQAMISNGAQASDDDFATIEGYLSAHLGGAADR